MGSPNTPPTQTQDGCVASQPRERVCGDLQCANSLQEQEADSSFNLSLLLPKCAMRPICASWCISGGDGFVYTCGILPMKAEILLLPPEPKHTEGFPRVAWELGGKGQPTWLGVLRGQRTCFEAAVSQKPPKNVGHASLCPALHIKACTDFSCSRKCS